ncbi:MAG: dephospho-CoA kinase [Nanoarchaeota archaeon]|nr:dephospho-CoA kinase [Nanoarchaeota archaeon]
MIIIVTGKQGSGKSTVARQLAAKGLKLIDADRIGHELLLRPDIKAKLVKAFSEPIVVDGRIDREKLAAIAFMNEESVKRLNDIVHPVLSEAVNGQIGGDCVIDAALYYELGLDKLDAITIDVRRPDSGNRSVFQKAIKKPDHVIENDGVLEELKQKVDELWKRLQSTRGALTP